MECYMLRASDAAAQYKINGMMRETGSKTGRQRRFNGRAESRMVKPMLKKSEDLDLSVLILGIQAVISDASIS